jgi:hypothetical protein
MDQTIVYVAEKIFGEKGRRTQDVMDHFGGNVQLAEAFLNGQIDWDGNEIVRSV